MPPSTIASDGPSSCSEAKRTIRPLDSSIRKRRLVSFNPTLTICHSLHINEYADSEIESSWYGKNEYKVINDEVRSTVKIMENVMQIIDDDGRILCKRGLESLTTHGIIEQRFIRQKALIAVLNEQDLQYEDNVYDPEYIADLYVEQTRNSQAEARWRGRSDEAWVRILRLLRFDIHLLVLNTRIIDIGLRILYWTTLWMLAFILSTTSTN